ncbi:homocysteine S-methyltransferase [Flagellimonas hymeniacidonis]|uniref:Homocysteine S-methyltransferase n=1 Tax=Flagellimonas hymeniacidonis TaxID=2603628 RepID=A0A5C8V3D6_9FLAO|nr:homocysteine S-methyltransferase family protein [Flagellimonas hymeniacidonis]TXN35841.1 homocysteine S-methyltransferase [Flagellimonas hymeniacidonis]
MDFDKNVPFMGPMLTDGGLETELIFHHNIDLPHFAAFVTLNNIQHTNVVLNYYRRYLELARQYGTGFILESPTWRANYDWAYKLGYSTKELEAINIKSIAVLNTLKDAYKNKVNEILISGCVGPRFDGYSIIEVMSAKEAKQYHIQQIEAFKKAGVDHVTGITVNYLAEGMGIVKAAKEKGLPVVISWTTEMDGRLPSGESLQEVIDTIDKETDYYPSYYMVNCAHPSHFVDQLKPKSNWRERIMGIRANASCKSHEELDNSNVLESGDKIELSNWYATLKEILPNLNVFGGCCGTDSSHIEAICSKLFKEIRHEKSF